VLLRCSLGDRKGIRTVKSLAAAVPKGLLLVSGLTWSKSRKVDQRWRIQGGGANPAMPLPQSGHGIHCGQLILRKISEIGATRCHLRLKCTKFDFCWGRPIPRWGAYSALPDPSAVFKGPSSKGGRGRRRGREGEGKERGG